MDAVEPVCVLSGLFATPVRGSGVADESADDELPVAVVDDEPDEPDEAVAMLGRPLLSVEEEVNVPAEPEGEELDDELESNGCASATPGMVATAVSTPSTTANAPTRPT